MRTLREHWPEYASEAICLGLLMISAAGVTTLLRHPLSPLSAWSPPSIIQRLSIGVAMGLTLVAIVYSPLGRRSGAHMNPALTSPSCVSERSRRRMPPPTSWRSSSAARSGSSPRPRFWPGRNPSVNFVATVPGARRRGRVRGGIGDLLRHDVAGADRVERVEGCHALDRTSARACWSAGLHHRSRRRCRA